MNGREMIEEGRHVMQPLKVSVALATYNGERFIGEQLESLAGQTRRPDELVVSDDGSADRTVGHVRNFAERAPFPVRILDVDRNRGALGNFDRVIAACRGDIVFPCDQDDVWLPGKIAEMNEALARYPNAGVVISNSELVDADLHPMGRQLYTRRLPRTEQLYQRGPAAVRLILGCGMVFGHTMAFRNLTLLMRPAALVTTKSAYDVIRVIIAASFFDIVVIPHVLTKYRRHESQVTPAHDVSLGLGQRLRQLVSDQERQAETTARFARNLGEIAVGLEELGAGRDVIDFLAGKVRMSSLQVSLPSARLRRLVPVASGLASGRYHRYANGISTAVRDLLRAIPHSPERGREAAGTRAPE